MIDNRELDEYQKALGFDLVELAREYPQPFTWIDMCCGQWNALNQGAAVLKKAGIEAQLTGVDLRFLPDKIRNISFHGNTNAATYKHPTPVQLITCLHGLPYIAPKLEAIESWHSQLGTLGQLKFTMMPEYIAIQTRDGMGSLRELLEVNGFECEQTRDFETYSTIRTNEREPLRLGLTLDSVMPPLRNRLGAIAPCSYYFKTGG